MANRPFLKRGAGTTDKYMVDYPVMARARQNERSSCLAEDDLTENAHNASVPVKETPNSAHEQWRFSIPPLVYEEPQRPISSESAARIDTGRGSLETSTIEANQQGETGYQSPEFIAPDSLITSGTNDSGLSESLIATTGQDSQQYRNAFSDPDDTRNVPLQGQSDRNRIVSLGAFPVNISEDSQNHRSLSPSSNLSSPDGQRSQRVVQIRKIAELVADDLESHASESSQEDTMDNVSEISSTSSLTLVSTSPLLMPSNRERQRVPFSSNPPNLQDSHFFERNIGAFGSYRRPEDVAHRSEVDITIDFTQTSKEKLETRIDETLEILNQSLAFTPQYQPEKGLSIHESHLTRQLRDTILNLDFAEAEMKQRFQLLERDVWEREQELEERRKV